MDLRIHFQIFCLQNVRRCDRPIPAASEFLFFRRLVVPYFFHGGAVMARYRLLQKAFMPRNPGEPPALWPIGTIVTSDDRPGLCWMPLDDDAAHAKTANFNQPSGPTQHVEKNLVAKSLGASGDRLSDPDRVIKDYAQTLRERLQKREHGHDQ